MSLQKISRRRLLKTIGLAGGLLFLDPRGQSYGLTDQGHCPQLNGKSVHWIVPNAPGGGYDLYSRLIKPFYEATIGTEIVIENVPGAGGIVGATKIKMARPDGLTQGILNAPGLMVASLTGETKAPNPADFTILGRVARNQHVWATGSTSPLHTMDDVLTEAQKRPLLFGISEVASTSFVDITVASSLLGIDVEFIAGFSSREYLLAALRGEVDLVSLTFESLLTFVEAGDLRPLLQLTVEPISSHPALAGIPLLGGTMGLAARRAMELGRDVEEARADAQMLANLIGGGRLIVAPLGLEESLFRCLEEGLYKALTDSDFRAAAAAAQRSLDVARADVARVDIQTVVARAEKFIPMIKTAIEKVRR